MFRLFKKNNWTIEKKKKRFFETLFSQLPSEFHFLQEHLQKGVYRRYRRNKDNNYFIGFDPEQSDTSMVKGRNFEIRNIYVIADGQKFPLGLTIYQGLLIGFDIPKNIIDFKAYRFDTSMVEKAKSKFAAGNKIGQLVKGLHSDHLDLDDLAEIEVKGKSYYQIKDLDDGNFIAIDNRGQVFGLIHDTFKIELLNKSIKDFVEKVNSGEFKFEEYLKY